MYGSYYDDEYLEHFGILGMKWGIRRFQNPDGSLTPEGRKRYGVKTVDEYYQKKKAAKEARKADRVKRKLERMRQKAARQKAATDKIRNDFKNNPGKYLKDAKWVKKHQDMLSNQDLLDSVNRIDYLNKLNDKYRGQLSEAKKYIDVAIGYGKTANSIIEFLNSDAGRMLRTAAGFDGESTIGFTGKKKEEKEAQEAKDKKEKEEKEEFDKKRKEERDAAERKKDRELTIHIDGNLNGASNDNRKDKQKDGKDQKDRDDKSKNKKNPSDLDDLIRSLPNDAPLPLRREAYEYYRKKLGLNIEELRRARSRDRLSLLKDKNEYDKVVNMMKNSTRDRLNSYSKINEAAQKGDSLGVLNTMEHLTSQRSELSKIMNDPGELERLQIGHELALTMLTDENLQRRFGLI